MLRPELLKLFEEMFEEEMQIFRDKGEEYTAGKADTEDALFNFKFVGDLVGTTCEDCGHSQSVGPKVVFAVYWLKHVLSIMNFVKAGTTPSGEGIMGRINDVRNYPGFLAALVLEDEQAKSEELAGTAPAPNLVQLVRAANFDELESLAGLVTTELKMRSNENKRVSGNDPDERIGW